MEVSPWGRNWTWDDLTTRSRRGFTKIIHTIYYRIRNCVLVNLWKSYLDGELSAEDRDDETSLRGEEENEALDIVEEISLLGAGDERLKFKLEIILIQHAQPNFSFKYLVVEDELSNEDESFSLLGAGDEESNELLKQKNKNTNYNM